MERKLDWNKPLVDQDGRPARLISADLKRKDGLTHVVAVAALSDGDETIGAYTVEGKKIGSSAMRIFNKVERRSSFIRLFGGVIPPRFIGNASVDLDRAYPSIDKMQFKGTGINILELVFDNEDLVEVKIHPVETDNDTDC